MRSHDLLVLRSPSAIALISFIVPAHNEAYFLGQTLEALRAAATTVGRAFEIIVVDDDSTDATSDIAHSFGARVIPVTHRHIAATRNEGARAARGETLIFVDADTHITAELLSAALLALEKGAAGGGAAVRLYGTPNWHQRAFVRFLSWVFRWTKIAPGCFVFATRGAFEAAGGFDEGFYAAEDIAISRALALVGPFVILRQAALTSDRKMQTHGLGDHLILFRQYFRHGDDILRSREHLGLWYGERRDPKIGRGVLAGQAPVKPIDQ